jgi:uncharacterized protein (DUF1778 family)
MSQFLKKILSCASTGLIWGLILAILLVVLISAIITLPGLRELCNHTYGSVEFINAANSDGLKYLPSFVVSSAAFVALLTYLREKKRIGRELEERRSRFFLEQSSAGLEEVFNLLKDQNNDRLIWLRAARVLLHSISLSKQISATEFTEAYRLAEEKIRHNLYKALSLYNEKTKERQALPPQFFYGLIDWQTERLLDEAAKLASQQITAQDVIIDKVLQRSTTLPLSKASVVAIYDFLEYPKEYKDPLHSVAVWRDHWDFGPNIGLGIDQGARRFVYHKLRHHAIDGKLYKNEMPDESIKPRED